MGYRDFDKSTGELSFWKNSSKKNETSVSRGLDYLELLITNSYGHAFDEKFRQAVLDLGAAVKYARSDKNKLYYRTPGSLKDFANGLARCGRVEHIVPVSVIVNKIRNVPLLDDGRIDRFAILFLFSKYYYLCAVSLEEDALLNHVRLVERHKPAEEHTLGELLVETEHLKNTTHFKKLKI